MIKSLVKIQIIEKILPELKKNLCCCKLCPRACAVNRLKGENGYCLESREPVVFSYAPHYGEEPPISAEKGSGTIFFSGCNMRCVYCQNYKFSQNRAGKKVSARDLGLMMLELEKQACHNINLVNPTHFVPAIIEALGEAYQSGLNIPIVYNTSGYDSLSVIKCLEGIVDVYLVDMRYSLDEEAKKYSQAPGYVLNNRLLVKEMWRQTGALKCVRHIAQKGLIIRLLILPNNISGTKETLEFISREIGEDVSLSVMSQYYPAYKASSFKELERRINREEYAEVISKMEELGMDKGWTQPFNQEFDARFAGENFEQQDFC